MSSSMPRPELSIVVPCYRMREAVFACVASVHADLLARGHATEGSVEVIVVESSGDDTAAALAAAHPWLRVIAAPARLNAAAARNLGARDARAELLVFVDADCTVLPGFSSAVLTAHAAGAGAVAGVVLPAGDEEAAGFVLFCTEFAAQLPRRAAPRRVTRFAPTCNLSLRRADLLSLGGFPEEHERSHDLAFCARWVAARRAPIVVDPAIRVRHHGPRGVGAAARHLYALGRASALVRKTERARAELAGHGLAAPWGAPLAPLLVPYRYGAIAARLFGAEDGPRLGARYVTLTPLALAALSAWALGFAAGAIAPADAK